MSALMSPHAPILPMQPPPPSILPGMPPWRYAWRYGALPLLANPELRALRDALHSHDARLYAGSTTLPHCLGSDDETPCCRACLLAYPLWQGRGLHSVASVLDAFGTLLHALDERLNQHGAWKPIIALWDSLGTPGSLLWNQVMEDVDNEFQRRGLS